MVKTHLIWIKNLLWQEVDLTYITSVAGELSLDLMQRLSAADLEDMLKVTLPSDFHNYEDLKAWKITLSSNFHDDNEHLKAWKVTILSEFHDYKNWGLESSHLFQSKLWRCRTVGLRARSTGTRSSTRPSTAPTMRVLLTGDTDVNLVTKLHFLTTNTWVCNFLKMLNCLFAASTPSQAGTCTWPTRARTGGSLRAWSRCSSRCEDSPSPSIHTTAPVSGDLWTILSFLPFSCN